MACGIEPPAASTSVSVQPTPDVEKVVPTAVATAMATATAEPSEVSKPEEIQIKDLIKGLRKGTVERVIDGDTIVLSSGEKIRYLEVSTPEMSPLECYAQEATQKNSELVLGKTIYIQSPTEGAKESYDRTLAYIFTDEYFVFLELVKNGYAIVELYGPPNEHYYLLKQAENDARLNNRGLWGKCDSLTPNPTSVPTAISRPTPTPTPLPTVTPRPIPTATPRPMPIATPTQIPMPNTLPAEIASQSRTEGKKQYDAKDYSGAIENYTKAIQNSPRAIDYFRRSQSYYYLELYEIALNDLNQTIALDPLPSAYNFRGLIYKKLGLYQEAIEDYTKAIELEKEKSNHIKFFNRGVTYYTTVQYQKAIDDFNKAIELSPDFTDAFYQRAFAYYELGLYEKSILDGMKVIQLDPNNNKDLHDSVYAYMGYSRYKLGQYQKAIDNFNKALELDPSEWEDNLRGWINNAENALSK